MTRPADAERKPTLERIDGVWRLKRVSPSQLKTFDLCNLKWFQEKRLKLPKKPSGKGVLLGLEGHRRMEHFLINGDDVRGPLERIGVGMIAPYLWAAPFNKGGGMVEAEVTGMRTDSGIDIVGFIDYAVPPAANDRDTATIIDHKFRKDIARYAETEDQLAKDPQAIIYSFWAVRKWNAERVKFAHHNYQTQGRRYAEERSYMFTAPELDGRWSDLQAKIQAIDDCAQIEDLLKVNHNPNACSAFGGCDFQKVCPRSPNRSLIDDLFSTTIEEKPMGLLDEMSSALSTPAASTGSISAAIPTAPVVTAPVAAPGKKFRTNPAGDCVEGRPYRVVGSVDTLEFQAKTASHAFFQNGAGAPVRLALTDVVEDLASPQRAAIVDAEPAAAAPAAPTGPAVGVKPPDAPAPSMSATDMFKQATELVSTSAPVSVGVPATDSVTVANTSEPAPETEAPATRRGRKPKDAASGPQMGGLILCVDAVPNQPHTDLSAWVADLAKNLALAGKVPDVRFAPKDHPFAFGGWKGALASKAIENAPTGLCVIIRSELTESVIESLAGVATMVIRG